MSNGSDNRVLTATGTDGMNAESNLTFDGTTLTIAGSGSTPILVTNGPINMKGNLLQNCGDIDLHGDLLGQGVGRSIMGISSLDATEITSSSRITVNGSFIIEGTGVSSIQKSTDSFADNDSLMTSAAILDKIQSTSGGTINNNDWSGTELSVSNGGTGDPYSQHIKY